MTKVALVYVTFDGVNSLYCGVGAITQYLLDSLPLIQEDFQKENIDLSFHLLFSSVPSNFKSNKETHERCNLLNDHVDIFRVPLKHGSYVSNPFGTHRSWPVSCQEASSYISKLALVHERVLVIANDTPYAGLTNFLLSNKTVKNIRIIWIPHSTGRIWNREQSITDIKRDNWESIAIKAAHCDENVFLGYISKYMFNHLSDEWGAPKNKLLPFINGVSLPYLNNYERKLPEEIEPLLVQYKIPINAPIFLSFARAQWYKGLDLSAELGVALALNYGVHPVILALDDQTGQAKNTINKIKNILKSYKKPYTLLTHYPTLLPRWLMQWPLCKSVGVLSRREPFGLIPSEFRILGPEDSFTITSDAGGLLEQTQNTDEGIIVPVKDNNNLSKKSTENILNHWGNAAQLKNSKAGRERVNNDYDIRINMYEGIRNALWQ